MSWLVRVVVGEFLTEHRQTNIFLTIVYHHHSTHPINYVPLQQIGQVFAVPFTQPANLFASVSRAASVLASLQNSTPPIASIAEHTTNSGASTCNHAHNRRRTLVTFENA